MADLQKRTKGSGGICRNLDEKHQASAEVVKKNPFRAVTRRGFVTPFASEQELKMTITNQYEMSMDKIYANQDQPRRNFCPRKLGELAQSIEENGLLEPIVVTPREDRFMIIAGERRFRASKIAGLKSIPARTIEADDKTVAELALLENLQREDLNPIEEARGYQNLMDMGHTMEGLAKKMGFKQTWRIRERLDLLRLAPAYQRRLVEKHITPSQAFEMSRLPHDKQHILYDKIQSGQASNYNKLRALTNALLVPPPQQITFGPEFTEKEKFIGKKYDQMIDRLLIFIQRSFDSEDLTILERVLRSSVSLNIQKIDLIIKDLNKIKKAMTQAESTRQVMAA
jgi:ParB family transcriptional regulator, chromosome partitioning protein